MTNLTMQCGTCEAPGRFTLTSREMPTEAPEGWVLVDIVAIGICGTDYHIFDGNQPYLSYPRVIGHELCGRVAETSPGLTVGTLVVINPYLACGTCRACRKGKPNCCARLEVLGVHRDGGMCARIAVPAGNLYPATGLSPDQAALVEFLAIGAHAVRRSETRAGDRVLVTGAGPIGLGVALFARLRGAEVHLLDQSRARLNAIGSAFGFSDLHGTDEPLLTLDLSDGFDMVFDATGNAGAIEAGFAHVAQGGTCVLVSVVKDRISFADAEFHRREMRIVGSRNATEEDFRVVMDALRSGDIRAEQIISERMRLAEVPERIAALARNREAIIKAIVEI